MKRRRVSSKELEAGVSGFSFSGLQDSCSHPRRDKRVYYCHMGRLWYRTGSSCLNTSASQACVDTDDQAPGFDTAELDSARPGLRSTDAPEGESRFIGPTPRCASRSSFRSLSRSYSPHACEPAPSRSAMAQGFRLPFSRTGHSILAANALPDLPWLSAEKVDWISYRSRS